jgi:hypothetical protein
MKKIKSIEKGTGESSTFFKVNDQYQHSMYGNKINTIIEEIKDISWCAGQLCDYMRCYRGYDISGQLLFEIEANSSLTISYDTET